jgi:hypothetical protein
MQDSERKTMFKSVFGIQIASKGTFYPKNQIQTSRYFDFITNNSRKRGELFKVKS